MNFLFYDQTRFDIRDFDAIDEISIMIHAHTLYKILLSCIQTIFVFIIFKYIWKFLESKNEKSDDRCWREYVNDKNELVDYDFNQYLSEDFEIEEFRSERKRRIREFDWNEKNNMIDRISSLILKSDYSIEDLLRIVCNEFQKDLKIRLMFKIKLEIIHIMNEMIELNSTRWNALRDVCKFFVMSKN